MYVLYYVANIAIFKCSRIAFFDQFLFFLLTLFINISLCNKQLHIMPKSIIDGDS